MTAILARATFIVVGLGIDERLLLPAGQAAGAYVMFPYRSSTFIPVNLAINA
jgi:hypothetical protein